MKKQHLFCIFCEKSFNFKWSLANHIRKHTGERPYQCQICSQCFKTTEYLRVHQNRHLGIKPYKCEVCNNAFVIHGDLKKHLLTHSGFKPFKCNVCNASFALSYYLLQHQRRTHEGIKPYTCNICNSKFSQKAHLISHSRVHTGEKPYKCAQCSKTFAYKGNLQQHSLAHSELKPVKFHQCIICAKYFDKPYLLRRHQLIHTGLKPFQCQHCNRRFKSNNSLKKHVNLAARPCSFQNCGKVFPCVGLLAAHNKNHNSYTTCNICSSKRYLARHIRTHTFEKQYKCSICKEGFTDSKMRDKHMTKHADYQKGFSCIFCGTRKAFYSDFQTHVRQHTKEKPFCCKYCQREFVQTGERNRHERLLCQ